MSSNYDYIQYDELSQRTQAEAKELFLKIETILSRFNACRTSSLAHTKLEEAYMWIGKTIRDNQSARQASSGVPTRINEQRTNS